MVDDAGKNEEIKFTREDSERLVRIEMGLESLVSSVDTNIKATNTHFKILDNQVAANTHFRRVFVKVFKLIAVIIPLGASVTLIVKNIW